MIWETSFLTTCNKQPSIVVAIFLCFFTLCTLRCTRNDLLPTVSHQTFCVALLEKEHLNIRRVVQYKRRLEMALTHMGQKLLLDRNLPSPLTTELILAVIQRVDFKQVILCVHVCLCGCADVHVREIRTSLTLWPLALLIFSVVHVSLWCSTKPYDIKSIISHTDDWPVTF